MEQRKSLKKPASIMKAKRKKSLYYEEDDLRLRRP
jgi:hypothetical protein